MLKPFIKNHLKNYCLGVLVVALAGCGKSSSTSSGPSDAEIKTLAKSGLSIEMMQLLTRTIPDPMTKEQEEQLAANVQSNGVAGLLKQGITVVGIKRGNPRASGAKEIILGIPDGIEIYPTRVTLNTYGVNKTIDFYIYKNDHNEWKLIPENP